MKISQFIGKLNSIKNKYGNLEVCHYNNMSERNDVIKFRDIKVVDVKNNPHISTEYCDPSERWLFGQAEFDKQKSFKVVSL